jgi:hypothetical protein
LIGYQAENGFAIGFIPHIDRGKIKSSFRWGRRPVLRTFEISELERSAPCCSGINRLNQGEPMYQVSGARRSAHRLVCEPEMNACPIGVFGRTEEQARVLNVSFAAHRVGGSAKETSMLRYSVAIAALLLGAPVAFAQSAGDTNKQGGASMNSGSGSSSSGPSSSGKSGGVTHERSGGSSGASEGASGSDSSASDVAPGHTKESGSAKENAPGQMKSDGSAREYAPGHRKDSTGKRSETKSKDLDRDRADRGDTSSDRKAGNDRDLKDRDAKNDRDNDKNGARTHDRGGASTGASEGTEGRSSGGRGSVTSVTTEQKTRIRSVFSRHHVAPVRNLNVAVNVGVRIPHSVKLFSIPADVVEIVPEYRGYMYIMLDDDRIAIVDPDTFEVLDIIVAA